MVAPVVAVGVDAVAAEVAVLVLLMTATLWLVTRISPPAGLDR